MTDDNTTLPTSAQQVVIAINNLSSALTTGLLTLDADNLTSGTIPAGRMPALTGDVTTTVGTVATTIANTAVTAAKLATDAVETAKIKDANVTQAKLASGVAGNGPAFSAYVGSAQTINTGGATKIQFGTEEYDTASCYDAATNYRFTPNVAGYYLVTGRITTATAGVTQLVPFIYKNGSQAYGGANQTATNTYSGVAAAVVSMNGSTDYVELYGTPVTTNAALTTGTAACFFQAFLIRAA